MDEIKSVKFDQKRQKVEVWTSRGKFLIDLCESGVGFALTVTPHKKSTYSHLHMIALLPTTKTIFKSILGPLRTYYGLRRSDA